MKDSIYVATTGGLVDSEGRRDFEGREVVAVDHAPGGWWAIVDGHELWTGAPGAWSRVVTIDEHRLNCLLPVENTVVVGTSEARLLRIQRDGESQYLHAFDELDERDSWFTPWGGPPDVRTLARTDDGALLINVHVGGILRTDDDGASYVPTIEIRSDVHEVLARNGMLFAATARGLATSGDTGATWRFETDGLHATYCRAVAVADDTVFASASVGPYGGRAAVYRRPLTGGPLEKCVDGLPEWFGDNIDTGCLAAMGSLAAFATSDGQVFLSEDRGASWEQVMGDLDPARRLMMVSD